MDEHELVLRLHGLGALQAEGAQELHDARRPLVPEHVPATSEEEGRLVAAHRMTISMRMSVPVRPAPAEQWTSVGLLGVSFGCSRSLKAAVAVRGTLLSGHVLHWRCSTVRASWPSARSGE